MTPETTKEQNCAKLKYITTGGYKTNDNILAIFYESESGRKNILALATKEYLSQRKDFTICIWDRKVKFVKVKAMKMKVELNIYWYM